MVIPVNLQLKEKKEGSSERSSAQVLSTPLFDSNLYPHNYPLDYRSIRCIRRDPTIQLARWCVLSQMIHTPWVYVKHERLGSKEMTDFLEEVLLPLRDQFLMQSVFGTLDYGWSSFEIVYKPDNGKIVVDKYKQLLPDYTNVLVYTNTGDFAGFANDPFGNIDKAKIINRQYALHTTFEFEGTDWYGESVYRILNSICDSWRTVESTAARYDKKIAGAAWVIYYPVGETKYNGKVQSNDEIASSLLTKLEASGSIGIPDEIQEWIEDSIDKEYKGKWRVELISDKGGAQNNFIDRQKYLDILKIRAFGFPERSILEGSHGTKEEASVHTDMALSTVDSKHRLICHWLNLYSISELLKLNFGEKYMWAARVRPAPLIDNQFATLKEMYHVLIQHPDIIAHEVSRIDMGAMRSELGIPSNGDESNEPIKIPIQSEKEAKEQKNASSDKESDNG